eukprot:SAG11_NODE_25888_length_352_cov_1.992095_1_plen_50_part_10
MFTECLQSCSVNIVCNVYGADKRYPFLLETYLMKVVDLGQMYNFHQVSHP